MSGSFRTPLGGSEGKRPARESQNAKQGEPEGFALFPMP